MKLRLLHDEDIKPGLIAWLQNYEKFILLKFLEIDEDDYQVYYCLELYSLEHRICYFRVSNGYWKVIDDE
jgi:hypothetical protein